MADNTAPVFWLGDGIATAFGIATSYDVSYSVAIQPDGKILAGGYGKNDFAVVRYNTDGSLDTTFGGDGVVLTNVSYNEAAYAIALQPDGKILLAGYSPTLADYVFSVVRYNADGTLDTTFDGDGKLQTDVGPGNDYAYASALQDDGKLIVAGYAANGSGRDLALVRYNTDGSLDTTFDADGIVTTTVSSGFDEVHGVALQSDGKIVVAGSTDNGSNTDFLIARYNADGSLDTAFDGDGIATTNLGSGDVALGIVVQPDGKLVVAGGTGLSDSSFAVLRYNADGSLDTTFGTNGWVKTSIGPAADSGWDLTLQDDGKILVSGYTNNGGDYDFAVIRYNSDGSLDTSFGGGDGIVTTPVGTGEDRGYGIAVQSDGKIVVTGSSNNGTNLDFAVVRYNADGSLDTGFGYSANPLAGSVDHVFGGPAIVLEPEIGIRDEELNTAGSYAGATLQLQRQGGANSSDEFGASGTLGALTEAGDINVGGTVIGTVTQNSAGTLLLTFNALATEGLVDEAMRQITYRDANAAETQVVVEWIFDDGNTGAQGTAGAMSVTGTTTVNATFLNTAPTFDLGDGIVTTDLGGFDDVGWSVALQSDGRIVVAGFSGNGLDNDFALARYNADGSLDTTFGGGDGIAPAPFGPGEDRGYGVAVQSDGLILLTGMANSDFALVRYNADGSFDTSFGGGDGIVTTPIGSSGDSAESVTVQSDGRILVAGYGYVGGTYDFALARYNDDGSLDTTFGGGDGIVTTPVGTASDYGRVVTVQSDGRILVAGNSFVGSYADFALVRYNSDGSLDTTFGGGDGIATTSIGTQGAGINGITLQSDGRILAVGFAYVDGEYQIALARYNADGSLDATFGGGDGIVTTSGGGYGSGYGVAVQSDGRILVAGEGWAGGTYDVALVRYNTDGTLDTTFGGGDGIVTTPIGTSTELAYSIALQADGRIVVSGESINGTDSDFALLRYNADGTLDTTFGTFTNTLDGAVTYILGDAPVVLDDDVSIYDAELGALNGGAGNYDGATLTLQRQGGADADDTFGATGTLSALTETGALTVDGTTIGTVMQNSVGTLVLSFNGNATQALVNEAMRQITYATSGPDFGGHVVEWTFDDGNSGDQGLGAGSVTGEATVAVAVAETNSAPTFAIGDGIVTTDIGGTSESAFDLAILPDGRLLATGSSGNGTAIDIALARYNTDGSLDTSFGGGDGIVTTPIGISYEYGRRILLQSDSSFVVAGFDHDGSDYNVALVGYLADGSLDTSFGGGDGIVTTPVGTGDDYGWGAALLADGKIVVTGRTYNDTTFGQDIALLRYNANGTIDTTFGGGDGIVITQIGSVSESYDLAVQADGKILVAGDSWDGTDYDFALIRYNANGSLDTSFGGGDGVVTTAIGATHDYGRSLSIQADGKILVAGYTHAGYNESGADFDIALVRYNADGAIDTSFGGGDGIVITSVGEGQALGWEVTTQSDGKILVAGYAENGVNNDFAILRYNNDGSLDTSFGGGDGIVTIAPSPGHDSARTISVQDDGKIVVGGSAEFGSGYDDDFAIVRLNSDGSLDTTFDPQDTLGGAVDYLFGSAPVVLDSDVSIYDAELVAAGSYAGATLQLQRAGGPDADDLFGATGTLATLTEGGDIDVGGTVIGTVTQNSGGTLLLTFGASASQSLVDEAMREITYQGLDLGVQQMAIEWTFDDGNTGDQGDGGAASATGTTVINALPINSAPTFSLGDGIVTTAIGPTADEGYSVAQQADGSILVAGRSWNGSDYDFGVVRYNADGSLDTSFGDDGIVTTPVGTYHDEAYSVAVQSDGRILVAGYSYNGSDYDFALVRYNADGSLDPTFGGDGIVTTDFAADGDWGYSVVVQSDGRILVAGRSYNGSDWDFALVRYNADGSLDPTFGGDGTVTTDLAADGDWGYSVALQSDGRILVAGRSYNGSDWDFALVRYDADGSLDPTFGGDGIVTTDLAADGDWGYSVALQSDGRILVAGRSYNGSDWDFALVRYNADGSLDPTFGGDGTVTTDFAADGDWSYSVAVQSDGRILVAGQSYNGSNWDFALVRYNADGSLDTTFGGDGFVTTDFAADGDWGYSVALQSDGRILVGGYSKTGADNDFALIRYNSDGSLDATFDPHATLDATPLVTFDGPVILDGDVTIFDQELATAGSYDGATLTLQRQGGASADDVFSATGTLGPLTETGDIDVGGTVIGEVTQNSAGTLVLSFGAGATPSLVNEALRQIAYFNADNATGAVTLEWIFDDGNAGAQGAGGPLSATGTTEVTVALFSDQANTIDLNGYDLAAFANSTDAGDGADDVTLSATQNLGVAFHGGAGNDTITGSAGDDIIDGGANNDTIDGGEGTDTASYGDAASRVVVDLRLLGSAQNTQGAGRDTLISIEKIIGSDYNDELKGGYDVDELFGGLGDDVLRAKGSNADTLHGGEGNDLLRGKGGDEIFYGDAGEDTILGAQGNDEMHGGDDRDILVGSSGDDIIYGDGGDDELRGNTGSDTMYGGDGEDDLKGGSNNDFLYGGADRDILFGENANDLLDGGTGNDTMTGGIGADIFVYAIGYEFDRIRDFGDGNDRIDLSQIAGMTDLAAVEALMTETATGHVNINFGGGDILQIQNHVIADFDSGDFIYSPV